MYWLVTNVNVPLVSGERIVKLMLDHAPKSHASKLRHASMMETTMNASAKKASLVKIVIKTKDHVQLRILARMELRVTTKAAATLVLVSLVLKTPIAKPM